MSENAALRLTSTTRRKSAGSSASAVDGPVGDAGVVHQHVDPAVPVEDAVHERVERRVVGDVAGSRLGSLQSRGQRLEQVGPAGDEHDRRAGLVETRANRAPEPGGGAR